MGALARLRALDDRVLGPPRPPGRTAQRNAFLVGVGGALLVLLLAVLTGRGSFLGGVGGFLGVALGSGGRWLHSERGRGGSARPVVATGAAVVLLASVLVGLTYDTWAEPRTTPFPPGFTVPEPTQLVQCDATAQGPAYAYQPPASAVPRCDNGAEPRVLLRP